MLKKDSIEDTPDFKAVIEAVEVELDEILKDFPREMGFCHHYWNSKHKLPKGKNGIEWRSPSMMNPKMMFN